MSKPELCRAGCGGRMTESDQTRQLWRCEKCNEHYVRIENSGDGVFHKADAVGNVTGATGLSVRTRRQTGSLPTIDEETIRIVVRRILKEVEDNPTLIDEAMPNNLIDAEMPPGR